MPAQILVRKLSKAQVEKSIADQKAGERLALKEEGGMLLVMAIEDRVGDPITAAALQFIADADAAIMQKERDAALAASKKK